MHVRQGEAQGLVHAVLCAKPCIGYNPFTVVLPYGILDEYQADQKSVNLAAMISGYKDTQACQMVLSPV